MTNEIYIYDYLSKEGFTPAGVCGCLGNFYYESTVRFDIGETARLTKLGMTSEQYRNAVDDGTYTNFVHDSVGWGIFQATWYEYKADILSRAKAKGVSIADPEIQMASFVNAIKTGLSALYSVLTTATDPREAAEAVLLQYERPASVQPGADEAGKRKVIKQRGDKAVEYFNRFSNANITGGGNQMKYKDGVNIPIQCMQTNSACYKSTQVMQVYGVLWHSTGCNNPNVWRYVQPSDNAPGKDKMLKLLGKNPWANDWNHIYHEAGLNAWIGKLADGTVAAVQTMPWNYKPWGCGVAYSGGPSCNSHWIQFEISSIVSA